MKNYSKQKKFSEKKTFVGISFSSIATNESAVAVLDNELNVLLMDKLYTIHDVFHFLENFQGIKNSVIAVSMAKNEVMISSKWKYLSRIYHPVNLNSRIVNRGAWADRFSKKGADFFADLKQEGYDIYRFDIHNAKTAFGCNDAFLDRTPADCKALQSGLKYKLNIENLSTNMIPVSELEALLGAYTIYSYTKDFDNKNSKKLFDFCDLEVIGFRQGVNCTPLRTLSTEIMPESNSSCTCAML